MVLTRPALGDHDGKSRHRRLILSSTVVEQTRRDLRGFAAICHRVRMVRIEIGTDIDAPIDRVFALSLDMDVHAASLAASRETATTSTGRAILGLGDDVTFSARHFGLRWRMTARVCELDAPTRFVDEQVTGPFREMRHEHTFLTTGDASTRVTDRVTFTAPLGPVGSVVTKILLAPYMRRLLTTRSAYMKQRAESSV
jgi:ligand-binding SRPBCC domain-containing protein